MKKLFLFLVRPDGMPAQEYDRWLLGAYADSLCADPRIRKANVNLARPACREAGGRGYDVPLEADAVIELWMDDDVPAAAYLSPVCGRVLWAWTAQERVRRPIEVTWAPGEPSPWTKRLSFLRRAPFLTREQFDDYWVNRHTPLALATHQAASYTQNLLMERHTPETPDCDGIVLFDYRDEQDYIEHHYPRPGDRETIAKDTANFIGAWDLGAQTRVWLLTEYRIRP